MGWRTRGAWRSAGAKEGVQEVGEMAGKMVLC